MSAKCGHTADSWAAVQSALAAAKAVAADQNATRTQINAAMEELVAAYSKLEYGVQKLHLEVAVEEAEKILAHPENYEDIAALKAALESGKAVLEDKDADQTAVDAAAEAIVQEFSAYLGRALAVFACVVDPEVIVVGGGVSKAGQILIDGVAKYYREAAFIACKDTPIVLASLGNDAGIYGAAKMLID